LIEKYAGAFPLWLAPEQVRILPISDAHRDYAEEVAKKLRIENLRVTVDNRNEKIGYKIREAQLEKIPYMLIIGQQEMEAGLVSVRDRKEGDKGQMSAEELLNILLDKVKNFTID
jgi:threonyl-tRNA synthetase